MQTNANEEKQVKKSKQTKTNNQTNRTTEENQPINQPQPAQPANHTFYNFCFSSFHPQGTGNARFRRFQNTVLYKKTK